MNLNPIFTRKIQESTQFGDCNRSFYSQGGAHVDSQQDMKEAIAGLFCILLYSTHKSLTCYILKSVFKFYHLSEMYGILAVNPAKLKNLISINFGLNELNLVAC